jgi:hypothetical protein
MEKIIYYQKRKNALGYILSDFFTNSSGHPDVGSNGRLRNKKIGQDKSKVQKLLLCVPATRVTRLGESPSIGWLFTVRIFSKIKEVAKKHFSQRTSQVLILILKRVRLYFGRVFDKLIGSP